MKTQLWYLYHSGFAVKTPGHFLVFDYYRDTPRSGGLEAGVIDPAALPDQNVVVFSSHRHFDHYNPVIFDWKKKIPSIRYVLSDDIPKQEGAVMAGPGITVQQPDFTLHTLQSTDEGVAFLLEIDGLVICHAGDLNWWHWNGETEVFNRNMARLYKKEINLLAGTKIDLAFVPVDPRLEDKYFWGLDYLLNTAQVARAVPMHYGDDIHVLDRLEREHGADWPGTELLLCRRRGQSFQWEK